MKINLSLELDTLSNDELVTLMVACVNDVKRRLKGTHEIADHPLKIPGYVPNEPAAGKPVFRDLDHCENKNMLMAFIKAHPDMPTKDIQKELKKQGTLFKLSQIYYLKAVIKKEGNPAIIKGKLWKRNPLAKPDYKD